MSLMTNPPFWNSVEEYRRHNMYKYPFSWIKHNRDVEGDFGVRMLLHIPVGLLIGLTFPLSIPLVWLFVRYEENEDLHTKDEAWKDYFGAMVGCAAGIVVCATSALIALF